MKIERLKWLMITLLAVFIFIFVITINSKVNAIVSENILEPDPIDGEIYYKNGRAIRGKGNKLLGKWKGLTYYSQADKKWANKLYTSTNNKKQTMKSSGCGPTCGAIIVSSAKGEILPTTMAKIAVENGFRTANSGTAWTFFPFIADYFEFKKYYTTIDFNKAMKYLKQKNTIGESEYYIAVSCGNGLFATSGHYIVLVGLNNGIIEVFDPYIYKGKFDTSSRKKANVKVKGNSVYVSEKNFKKYANYKRFWIYSNDKGNAKKKPVNNTSASSKTKYTRYVKVRTYLNVRKGPATSYKIVGGLKNGTKVTVYETKNGWSRISTNRWVSNKYLVKKKTTNIKNTVGQIKTLKRATVLYSKSNLTGKRYNYKKNTTVKVLKNVSNTVDYIRVVVTGRKAYVNTNNFK